MKRKVLGVLFTAMCLCAVPSAAYAEAQEAETTEAAGEAADEPEAGAETVTELSDSLYDFQVKIGDKVYQFPMYYQDFAADWTHGKNEDPEIAVEPIPMVHQFLQRGRPRFRRCDQSWNQPAAIKPVSGSRN